MLRASPVPWWLTACRRLGGSDTIILMGRDVLKSAWKRQQVTRVSRHQSGQPRGAVVWLNTARCRPPAATHAAWWRPAEMQRAQQLWQRTAGSCSSCTCGVLNVQHIVADVVGQRLQVFRKSCNHARFGLAGAQGSYLPGGRTAKHWWSPATLALTGLTHLQLLPAYSSTPYCLVATYSPPR